MKSIKMDFVRGGDDTGVFQKGQRYHVIIESSRHRQFNMPLNQEDFLNDLMKLRYHRAISDGKRKTALRKLSRIATRILEPPVSPADILQLDVVTNARELWALPFEAALAPDGRPLLARRDQAVVLTRRAPQQFAERQPNWPARPRVLFAHASPKWAGGSPVEASKHKEALLEALQPWIEPLASLPCGDESSVLTTLKEASLSDIKEACRQAKREGRPYTHVHLLAHGVKIQDLVNDYNIRYGIALRSNGRRPTKVEALVRAICPPPLRGQGEPELPLVVTLAICDSGNAANSIIEAGGLAQEFHRAGVPIVVASQLPLTFAGSRIITSKFYKEWMDGKDVRAALHETRVALFEAEGAGHDWVSMVAYVRLPEGYSEYLLDLRLVSQLAALETASNHAKRLLEMENPGMMNYKLVTDRLRRPIKQLEEFLNQYDSVTYKAKIEVEQENAGLLGSAYKRLAELLAWQAKSDATQREQLFEESRAALKKARDVYRESFRRNPSHHWSGVQYLALDAVLTGQGLSTEDWYACYVAAKAQRDNPRSRNTDQIWAFGSIAELALIAPLVQGAILTLEDATAALTDLRDREERCPPETFNLSPIFSTRRQLMRYVDWWVKANGFFEGCDKDLVDEALTLARLL